jgi:hypothetical protein
MPELSPSGMLHPSCCFSPDNIATAILFLRQCRAKTKTKIVGSYYLKHLCERWGERNGQQPYVANGEMILAALWVGLPVQWDGRHINVDIAVPRGDVTRLINEEQKLFDQRGY